jgi:membrane-bound metal-dependent hydrolase YbcI (DUF457 family)
MPSPIGHALGGIAAGWGRVPRRDMAGAAILAAVSLAPDLDLLPVFQTHRGPSHSIGAAALAGAIAWLITRRPAWAASVSLSWASHIVLDWMSNDTRPPLGVMALWPLTSEYYKAGFEVFPAVSRRYWLGEFWYYNAMAAAIELVLLLPVTLVVLSRYRSRARSSGRDDPRPPSGGAEGRDGISDRPGRRGAR